MNEEKVSACAAPLMLGDKKLGTFKTKPYKQVRFIQIDGKTIKIKPISVGIDGNVVCTVYAPETRTPSENKNKSSKCFSKQGSRILEAFLRWPNQHISSIELHKAGSGKEHGFVASLSRRISDLRCLGHNIVKSKEERVKGVRHTFYMLVTPE